MAYTGVSARSDLGIALVLLCHALWLVQNSLHLLNQSDLKPEPLTTCVFPRFYLSSHWFFFKFPLIPPDWVLRLLWFGFYVTRSCVLKRNTDQVNKKCDSLNFGKFLCLSHGLYYISHYIPERFYFIGDRLEPLYAPIRFKLASALTNWHPSDPSAKMMLEPWSKVQTSLADS